MGTSCFDIARVTGCSRVPEPPARIIPFNPFSLSAVGDTRVASGGARVQSAKLSSYNAATVDDCLCVLQFQVVPHAPIVVRAARADATVRGVTPSRLGSAATDTLALELGVMSPRLNKA